ncbi:MAG: hypothetical protein LBF60_00820 [Treponema sp.]|nr:hypothetical protein [Treponema sp.]
MERIDFMGKTKWHIIMSMITSELISLFGFLLPGFITSFLFYSLTSFPKKSEFEAVVIALIWTIVINALVELLEIICTAMGSLFIIGEWNQASKTIASMSIALIISLVWSCLYSNDILHKWLRKWKITNQTSYPSEWYGILSLFQNANCVWVSFGISFWRKLLILYGFSICGLSNFLQG